MRTTHRLAVVLVVTTAFGCGDDTPSDETPTSAGLEPVRTAYIAEVIEDPPGDDLAPNGGEYVVIRNDATIPIDMGSWWIEVDGEQLHLGVGRQIEVGGELRVHTGSGQETGDAIFAGLDHEVLEGAGLVLLRDAAGAEVSRLDYGA